MTPEAFQNKKEANRQRHQRKKATDPEYLKRRREYRKEYVRNPKNRARVRASSRKAQDKYYATPIGKERRNAYLAKRRATNLVAALVERVRNRLGRALKQAVINQRSSRSLDSEGIAFLRWDFERRGLCISELRSYHVDHLIPLMLWESEPRPYGCNSPENLRWLIARENMQKKVDVPDQKEIQAHLLLVAEWRRSLIEQKQVVPENKIATL